MNNGVYLVSHLPVYYMYLSRAQHETKTVASNDQTGNVISKTQNN